MIPSVSDWFQIRSKFHHGGQIVPLESKNERIWNFIFRINTLFLLFFWKNFSLNFWHIFLSNFYDFFLIYFLKFFFDMKFYIKFIFYFAQYFVIKILFCIFFLIIYFFLAFIKLFFRFTGRFAPDPDPLLSASNKSGQKCLSAHFAISNNVSLCSPLVKFEAEPNFCINFNVGCYLKNFF